MEKDLEKDSNMAETGMSDLQQDSWATRASFFTVSAD